MEKEKTEVRKNDEIEIKIEKAEEKEKEVQNRVGEGAG